MVRGNLRVQAAVLVGIVAVSLLPLQQGLRITATHAAVGPHGESDVGDATAGAKAPHRLHTVKARAGSRVAFGRRLQVSAPSPLWPEDSVSWAPRGAKGYEFTSDWFTRHADAWRHHVLPAFDAQARARGLSVLELGAYEGRASVWLLENLLRGPRDQLHCVDTFMSWEELQATDGDDRSIRLGEYGDAYEGRFDHNIRLATLPRAVDDDASVGADAEADAAATPPSPASVIKYKTTTLDFLAHALHSKDSDGMPVSWDLIYVDASHNALDALSDVLLAWTLLRPGGVMVCDDYLHRMARPEHETPHTALDTFFRLAREPNGDAQLLGVGYQLFLRKRPAAAPPAAANTSAAEP